MGQYISSLKMSAMENEDVRKQRGNYRELRIVMVGKTGVGKSATGNTILGQEHFRSELSCSSVTSDCGKQWQIIGNRLVAIIDTPGLFDTTFKNEEIQEKIKMCISLSAPGPHVFLVIIQLGRFTNEEKETVEIIKQIFGEGSSKYTIVLFTNGDRLNNKTIHEFVCESPDLMNFIKSTSGRYHVFNNNHKDPVQVTTLLEEIDQLIVGNGGDHYTNEMLQMAEQAIQEEQLRLQEEKKSLDPQEAREKAERSNRFLKTAAAGIGLAGVAGVAGIAAARGNCAMQ